MAIDELKDLIKLIDSRVGNTQSYRGSTPAQFGNYSNIDSLRRDLAEHGDGISAHGIQELILDTINAQILENGGLEEVEIIGNNTIPLKWSMYPTNYGGSGTTTESDATKKKYGSQSLKFNLSNSNNYDINVGISQNVPVSRLDPEALYNLSYYYMNDSSEEEGYTHYLEITYFDLENNIINVDSFSPEKTSTFERYSTSFTLPESTDWIRLVVGARVKSGYTGGSIWIDYPMLNIGNNALIPPELTEGIIDAKFIKADEAIIDKLFAGQIDTNRLKIISQDGTMVLEGNTLKIKSGEEEGKDYIILGSLDGEHGLQINDLEGNARIKTTPNKITLRDIEIDSSTYILNEDGSKTYLSKVKSTADEVISLKSQVSQTSLYLEDGSVYFSFDFDPHKDVTDTYEIKDAEGIVYATKEGRFGSAIRVDSDNTHVLTRPHIVPSELGIDINSKWAIHLTAKPNKLLFADRTTVLPLIEIGKFDTINETSFTIGKLYDTTNSLGVQIISGGVEYSYNASINLTEEDLDNWIRIVISYDGTKLNIDTQSVSDRQEIEVQKEWTYPLSDNVYIGCYDLSGQEGEIVRTYYTYISPTMSIEEMDSIVTQNHYWNERIDELVFLDRSLNYDERFGWLTLDRPFSYGHEAITKTLNSEIKQNAESIKSKVDQTTFNELEDTVEGHTSEITQTAEKISHTVQSLSSSGNIATLVGDYDGTYTQINITPLSVDLKEGDTLYIVDKNTGISYNCIVSTDTSKGSISIVTPLTFTAPEGSGIHLAQVSISSKIEQTESAITQKAEKSDVYTKTEVDAELGTKVDTTIYETKVGELEVSFGGISGRVTDTEFAIGDLESDVIAINENIASLDIKANSIRSLVESYAITDSIATLSGDIEGTITQISVSGLGVKINVGDKLFLVSKESGTKVDLIASEESTGDIIKVNSFALPEKFIAGSLVYLAVPTTLSRIDQTATNIRQEVTNVESGLQGSINVQAGRIDSVVGEIDGEDGLKSRITQTESDISSVAGRVDTIDGEDGSISNLQSKINQEAGRIDAVVFRVDSIDGEEGYIAQHESRISQTESNIQTVVTETIPGLDGRLDTAEGKIDVQAGEIELSVKVDSLVGAVSPKIKISGEEEGYILLDAQEVIVPGTIKGNLIEANSITSDHITTLGLNAEVIKAGILDLTSGLSVKSSNIHIDDKGFWAGASFENAKVSIDPLSGKIKAIEGEIGGFTLGEDNISSLEDKLILDANGTITLTFDENYKTYITYNGIYSTVPFLMLTNYDPSEFSEQYYVEDVEFVYNGITYKDGKGFSASNKGEVVRYKNSELPVGELITVNYTVVDGRIDNPAKRTPYTESLKFDPTLRNSVIITENSILDAEYVNNLIVGYADIGYGSITDAHINNLSADKIDTGILNVSKGIEIKTDYGFSLDREKMILPSNFTIQFNGEEKTFEEVDQENKNFATEEAQKEAERAIKESTDTSLQYNQSLIIDNRNTQLYHFDENLTSTNGSRPLSYHYVKLGSGKFSNSLQIMPNGFISYSIPTECSIFTYIRSQPNLDYKNQILSMGDFKLGFVADGRLKITLGGSSVETTKSYDSDWFTFLLNKTSTGFELTTFLNGEYETISIEGMSEGDLVFGEYLEIWLDELRISPLMAISDGELWSMLNQPFRDPSPRTVVPLPSVGSVEFVSDDEVIVDDEYVFVSTHQIIEG